MMMIHRSTGLMAALVGLWLGAYAHATPPDAGNPPPLQHFASHDPDSRADVPHRIWAAVLGIMFIEHEKGPPELDYSRMSIDGRDALKRYLRAMQKIPVSSLNRDEQLAYWLNFYNAAGFNMVFEQLDGLAKRSRSPSHNPHRKPTLRLKKRLTDDDGPWREKRYTVEGVNLSISDIEHRIIGALWDNPLVMYGLSCPAEGCPRLRQEPFRGATVWTQLAQAANEFIARKDGARVKRGKLEVSSLYLWHRSLFGDDAALIDHIGKAGGVEMATALSGITSIDDDDFDWSLNGKMPPPDWQALPIRGMSQRGAGVNVYQP